MSLSSSPRRGEEAGPAAPSRPPSASRGAGGRGLVGGPLGAVAVVAAITGFCWLTRSFFRMEERVLVFLMGVLFTAARFSRRDAVIAALASVAAFDFYFVPPVFGFAPTDLHHLVTLAAFLATSLVVSGYAASVRAHAEAARDRERRTSALYALSRALTAKGDVRGITEIATRAVRDSLGADAAVVVDGAEGAPDRGATATPPPAARGLHLPLRTPSGTRGVLHVAPPEGRGPPTAAQVEFLDALSSLLGVALERVVLVEEAERARLAVETERARSTLLSAISHDLRTPLASITGALGALVAPESSLSEEARARLLEGSHRESERLGRIVANLLDLARVEAGGCEARREWYPVEDLVASAMERVHARHPERPVEVDGPEDVVQVRVDGVLVEQVVENLLENAARHTPPGSPIVLRVRAEPARVLVEVLDRGPGIAPEELERIFEPFHRAPSARKAEGTGLGLALCRAVVAAHGGRIWAENRPDGGAAFRFALPREKEPLAPVEESRGGQVDRA